MFHERLRLTFYFTSIWLQGNMAWNPKNIILNEYEVQILKMQLA